MDPWLTSYCKVKGKNMKKHLKQWFDEMCRMHISFCICSIIHNNRHNTYMIYVDLSYVCRLPTLDNFPKVPYRSGQSGRLLKSEAKKAARIPMILGHCHPWGLMVEDAPCSCMKFYDQIKWTPRPQQLGLWGWQRPAMWLHVLFVATSAP